MAKKVGAPAPKSEAEEALEPNPELSDDQNAIVEIDCYIPLRINGKLYQGKVQVPRHMADSMRPMLEAKRKTDLEIFTGRKFHIDHLLNGDRSIKQIK